MSVSNVGPAPSLQQSVESLEQRVRAMEDRLEADPAPDPASIDLSSLMADVVRVTQQLFPGEVSAYILSDPEYPQNRFTVIEAEASGPAENVVERRAEWHRLVSRLSRSCSTLRLTLNYRE